MNCNKFNVFIDKIGNLAKDPEHFLLNKHKSYRNSIGFRIDLYTAKKYNSFFGKHKWFKPSNFRVSSIIPDHQRSKSHRTNLFARINPKKTFCPYCEKAVVPKRVHKLDFADIIIALFTAGLWVIFIFIMYLFIRKCPTCNYNLRGFKFLSEKKRR